MALCDSQYSKIAPLSGGEIIFATLGNRPSNENFEDSKVLQVRRFLKFCHFLVIFLIRVFFELIELLN